MSEQGRQISANLHSIEQGAKSRQAGLFDGMLYCNIRNLYVEGAKGESGFMLNAQITTIQITMGHLGVHYVRQQSSCRWVLNTNTSKIGANHFLLPSQAVSKDGELVD